MPIADTLMPIHGEDDIVLSRQRAREMAKQLGFGAVDQSRIATAVSELARNVVRYATAGRGEVTIRELAPAPESRGRVGIEIVVSDEGPGIPDINQALSDGYTSGSGMGMGLPGTRRLMDEMSIDSVVGRGTVVTIRKWRR
jgi:serine/threonine-protein kinase RsbT